MKLTLNKKKIKNLSKDNKSIPSEVTPQIGGGGAPGDNLSKRVCHSDVTCQVSVCKIC